MRGPGVVLLGTWYGLVGAWFHRCRWRVKVQVDLDFNVLGVHIADISYHHQTIRAVSRTARIHHDSSSSSTKLTSTTGNFSGTGKHTISLRPSSGR
jgi:hypothetical protein